METQTTLNIVQLIESNPLINLNKDYKSKLIDKIKKTFTEYQQQLFVASFLCYLNFNQKTDFVIDLDDIWKWLGFERKSFCKRVLEKHFIQDIDYKIENISPSIGGEKGFSPTGEKPNLGGRPVEKIKMTINTFKKLCLKSNTKKADEIHEYYIQLEETFQEITIEESNELKKQLIIKEEQLQIKDKTIKEKQEQLTIKDTEHTNNLKINKHKLLIELLKNKKAIYTSEIEKNLIKLGSSKDIDDRKQNLKAVFGECIYLDVFECEDFREIEQNILVKVHNYKYKEPINGHISKEVIQLTEAFNYNQLVTIIKNEIKNYKEEKFKNINLNLTPEQELIKNLYDDFKNNIITFDQFNILINSINSSKKEIVIENATENNRYKINETPRGRKIQLINPDNLGIIVKVYDSIGHVLKDNKTYTKQPIQKAIKNNTVYKGFRWKYVEFGEDHTIVKDIEPTVCSKQPENNIIVQLNKDKNEIIDAFNGVTILKKQLKIGDRKLHKTIDENLLYNDTYFMKLNDCPKILVDNYCINNELPSRNSCKSKPVMKINQLTKEETIYKSLTQAALDCNMSDATITNYIKNGIPHRGFLWGFI